MRIINVLKLNNGLPEQLVSFPIEEEQLSDDVIKECEDLVIELVNQYKREPLTEEEEKEIIRKQGWSDNGIDIYILWSDHLKYNII